MADSPPGSGVMSAAVVAGVPGWIAAVLHVVWVLCLGSVSYLGESSLTAEGSGLGFTI